MQILFLVMYGGANRSGSAIEKIVFYLEYPRGAGADHAGLMGKHQGWSGSRGNGGKRLCLQGVLSI